MKNVVIYHANCQDGHTAAWIARNALPADTEFIPANYGDPVPNVLPGSRVWILDFSYPRDKLLGLVERCESVKVLDHHKTAQKDLEGLPENLATDTGLRVFFNMNKSGGLLTWEHFFPDQVPPWLVYYTMDRDLWTWKLPHSREINAALASYPRTFEKWDNLNAIPNVMNTGLVTEGAAILRYQDQIVEQQCKNAVEITMDGFKVLAVNATVLISEIAGKLATDRPFGATYFLDGKGRRIWSLRSREGGADVSEIAKKHGGGGHKQAAGFQEG